MAKPITHTIPLKIDKDSKEDCPYDCIFRDCYPVEKKYNCLLFKQELETIGPIYNIKVNACINCQELFDRIIDKEQ